MTTQNNLSVFDYTIVSDYLNAIFLSIKSQRPAYSMRAWTLKLGVSDSGSLSRILSGRRRVPAHVINQISEMMNMNIYERSYFELISVGQDRISGQAFEVIRASLRAAANSSMIVGHTVPSPDTNLMTIVEKSGEMDEK